MTDCDLCGRGIPTVNPVRVQGGPLLKFAYPEGVWKGLCEVCLESAQATLAKVDRGDLAGTSGKCKLCGTKTDLYPVELHIPNFRKGVVKENVMLCEECLKVSGQAFAKFKREEAKHRHH